MTFAIFERFSVSDHVNRNVSYDPNEVNLQIEPLTSPQIRAARGLLRWSAEELAREAALGLATIRRLRAPKMKHR